jgi:hypothetical protein
MSNGIKLEFWGIATLLVMGFKGRSNPCKRLRILDKVWGY